MTAGDREANVLGALALAITDRAEQAVAGRSGLAPSAAAALSALYHFLDRPTVERLRQVLGLTHSGVVRLVDRLAGAGLVAREPGADGRSRSVVLTVAGRAVAAALSAARAASVTALLDGFDDADRAALHALISRLMANLVRDKDGGAWVCRMCDLAACRRAEGECPAAREQGRHRQTGGDRRPGGGLDLCQRVADRGADLVGDVSGLVVEGGDRAHLFDPPRQLGRAHDHAAHAPQRPVLHRDIGSAVHLAVPHRAALRSAGHRPARSSECPQHPDRSHRGRPRRAARARAGRVRSAPPVPPGGWRAVRSGARRRRLDRSEERVAPHIVGRTRPIVGTAMQILTQGWLVLRLTEEAAAARAEALKKKPTRGKGVET